jgi:hypothetical protein
MALYSEPSIGSLTPAGKYNFMSAYTNDYKLRYETPSFQQQIEVAIVTAAQAIVNEATNTADHANRMIWAQWALDNSNGAAISFLWACAMNSTIQQSFTADPTGGSINDGDVQYVINSYLPTVLAALEANPPPAPHPLSKLT